MERVCCAFESILREKNVHDSTKIHVLTYIFKDTKVVVSSTTSASNAAPVEVILFPLKLKMRCCGDYGVFF
jgi:hypothetical protein